MRRRRRRRRRARILITSRFAMAAASPGRLFRDNNITPTQPPVATTTGIPTTIGTADAAATVTPARTPRSARQPSPKGMIVVVITAATSGIITDAKYANNVFPSVPVRRLPRNTERRL